MKKALFICGLCAALLASCTQSAEDGLTTIRVGHQYVESGSLYHGTRTVINADLDNALADIMPVSIPLTLTGAKGVYTCLSGQDVTLPFGHYAVTGTSTQTKTYVGGTFAWVSPEPLIEVDDAIDVTYGLNEYTVGASIHSFVLAWDNTIVKSVSYMSTSGLSGTLPEVRHGGTSVCCVTGALTGTLLGITLNPWEGQPWSAKSFTLTTSPDRDGILCEAGRWYAVSPVAITAESGAINIQCSVWAEGGEY